MMIEAVDDKIIVKIYSVDKEAKITSKGGIITSHPLKPTMDYCQIGEAVSVGRNINYIKNGETLLFSWFVEDENDNILDKDEDAEYRYVTERQIYGTVKNDKTTKYNHIQPKKNYVLAQPNDDDFERTRTIFQIPVSATNPQDIAVRKLKIKSGDWVIVLPNCAVPITVKRQTFWMICIEDILCINRGQHRVSINRKKIYKDLRLASRNIKTELN